MEVHLNNKDHLNDFIRLNEEWISKYFSIEAVDRELAKNPAAIIENNGYIFSLVENNSVLGVCALFNEGDGVYELARMAVSPSNQGRGYGNILMKACLDKIEEIHAKKVYLVSNTKLETAISIYKKYGFIAVEIAPHPIYSRANIVMELST